MKTMVYFELLGYFLQKKIKELGSSVLREVLAIFSGNLDDCQLYRRQCPYAVGEKRLLGRDSCFCIWTTLTVEVMDILLHMRYALGNREE